MQTQYGDISLTDEITVKLIDSMASDIHVTRAAQVSVKGENNPETDTPRLINYLMESRHGSPFEHTSFTFFVKAPLFVFREWQRHRISSFNEMSGRYTQLEPLFYIPQPDRKLVNVGTPARPEFAPGDYNQRESVFYGNLETAQQAWKQYKDLLDMKVANEVARTVLPLSIFSQMYWTVNARSIMNFLSLRVDSEDATYRTRPQWEIQLGAQQIEEAFAEKMPHTYQSFVLNGRVAP